MALPDSVTSRFKGVETIRLATGVIGKTSVVAGITLIGLSAIGFQFQDPSIKLVALATIALIFLLYFAGVLIFAHKHPDLALLEGSELIQLRKIEQASKSKSVVKPRDNTTPEAVENVKRLSGDV